MVYEVCEQLRLTHSSDQLLIQPSMAESIAVEPQVLPQDLLTAEVSNVTVPNERLFLSTKQRVRFATIFAAMIGGALGFSHGASNTGLRFQAENAHRLPTSEKGWYFYHKTKNYAVLQGGIKEGGRMALKLGFWSGLFFMAEAAIDRRRRSRDAASSVCAGMAVAGAFSLWSECWVPIHDQTRANNSFRSLAFHNSCTNDQTWLVRRHCIWTCARRSRSSGRSKSVLRRMGAKNGKRP